MYIVQGNVGYGGYSNLENATLVYSTPGYEAPENLNSSVVAEIIISATDATAAKKNAENDGLTIVGAPETGVFTRAKLNGEAEAIEEIGTKSYAVTQEITVGTNTETIDGVVFNDDQGTASTIYDIGMNIVDNSGTIDVTVGVGNAANNYVYTAEFEGISVPSSDSITETNTTEGDEGRN